MRIRKGLSSFKKLIKNSLFREFSIYGSSTIVFHASRVLVELVVANILGPKLWGIWYILNLVISYRVVFHGGIANGMNREVPIYRGNGELDSARKIVNVSGSFIILTTSFSVVVILISSVFVSDPELKTNLILLIFLLGSSQFFYFIETVLRSYAEFNIVSGLQFLFAILFPFICLPLSKFFQLEGFIIGFSLVYLITGTTIYFKSKLKFEFDIDRDVIIRTIRIGFPIMLVGIAYTLMNTADRWIITASLDIQELGKYSIAIIVFSAIMMFPKIISQQLYPRMAFDWGKSKNKKVLLKWTKLQTKYTAYLVIPLVVIVYLTTPVLIPLILPEYVSSIKSVQIIVFGLLAMPLSAGWGNILNILDKQVYYLVIICTGIVINVILNIIFVKLGYGIEGVAFGTTLSFFLYNFIILITGKYIVYKYV